MRVTQNMLTDTMLRNLSRNTARLERLQDQLSSGQMVSRPSDDPIAAAVILRLDGDRAQTEQFIENVDDGIAWLNTTDQALSSISDAVQRAQELAIRAANDALSSDDRQAIAMELRALSDHVVQVANTKVAGQYIFAGQRTHTAPFDSGFPPTYQGDAGAIVRQVDTGTTVTVNVVGSAAIQPVLDAIHSAYLAVTSGDSAAMQASIDQIDAAHSTLLAAQAQVGATTNRLEAQRERLLDVKTNVAKLRSETQDVDMAEAMMNYSVQELAYRAALEAGAKAIQPTLVDYLR
ncbi:MAG: flagellar hook-associated protein FlgL [Thermomicrobiaceae bacterium]|nr:flagellar hook-associated protein FlgL [Thermomicrobiaceae bacterium]